MYVCVRHGSMCAPPCRLVLMPLILISSAGVFLCFPMPMSKPRINTAANRLGDCLSRCLFLSHPLLLEVWMAAQWFVVCKWLDCLIGRCVSAGSDGVVLSFFIQFPTIIVPQTPQILSGERSALEPVQAGMDLPGDGGDLVRHALLFGTGLRRFCCWFC